jgi:oxygen-independent coproporphyrinogen-3 oxidase
MERTILTASERDIYRRYASLALPRHTSYPIAPAWRSDYRPVDFRRDLARSAESGRPRSLYVHVPFCERLCYYCACTKEIVPASKRSIQDPTSDYLEAIEVEINRLAETLGPGEWHQVHLGGGSPTFLRPNALTRLWNIIANRFDIASESEIAVEIDPRITTREQLCVLSELGFNRVSLGVQDFSPTVQSAVNRIQPFETVHQVVEWCRELGFASINFDLIYGLPFQTVASMTDTLMKTIAMSPDRVAFYRLAVIPEIFRWQNVFRQSDLPDGDLPLDLNLLAIETFQNAGYEFIGLDHFARSTDPLSHAHQDKTLRRNFQGMTTGKPLDVIGVGPSAISQLDTAFAQNAKLTADWRQLLEVDLGTERGLRLSDDDRIRREVMQQLYGYGAIDKPALESRFGIAFEYYFAKELSQLEVLADEGIVQLDGDSIYLISPLGRLLVRVVAAVFDAYLPPNTYRDGLPAHLSSKVG